jgi:transposase
MQSDSMVVGVDVAKDELVVAVIGEQMTHSLANAAQEIRAWLRTLPKGSIVAMESTGVYHQLLARLAHAAAMRVYVLNARDVYLYGKALGGRAKTDRVDAMVIARYACEHHEELHQWQPASGDLGRIDELLRRRAVVVTKREAVVQCLSGCKDLQPSSKQFSRAFDILLQSIDRKIKELIAADEQLHAAQRRISTVIGFGPLGSALLAVLLARFPFANADSVVAYSGWDPRSADSGQKRGRRKLTKRGPAYLRRQWYMTGLTAARTRALKPLYQAIRARGLATTEAFVILARKLLRAAYAVWKTDRPFDLQTFLGRPQTA